MDINHAITVVIPAYNEVDSIGPLIEETISVLSHEKLAFEIVCVDDGSHDGTREYLNCLAKTTPQLRVVAHRKNYGQSIALISGVKAASFSLIAVLDGDGQNDPVDIVKMFHFIQNQNKVIILGNRINRKDSLIHKLYSKIGNSIRVFFLRGQCPDTGCSLKLFPREAFLFIPHFNHMHRYLPDLFTKAGYQLINVPVNHRPRLYGVSKYRFLNRFWLGIHDLIGVHWLLKRFYLPELHNDEL